MTAPRPTSAKSDATQTDNRPKALAMLVFGGLATLVIFFVLAAGTDLPSIARIVVSSLAGCLFGWLAGRYKLARAGGLVLVLALVALHVFRDRLAA